MCEIRYLFGNGWHREKCGAELVIGMHLLIVYDFSEREKYEDTNGLAKIVESFEFQMDKHDLGLIVEQLRRNSKNA